VSKPKQPHGGPPLTTFRATTTFMGALIMDQISREDPYGNSGRVSNVWAMADARPGTSPSGRAPRAKAVSQLNERLLGPRQEHLHGFEQRLQLTTQDHGPIVIFLYRQSGPRPCRSTNSFALRGWSDRLARPGLARHLGRRAVLSWLSPAAISSTGLKRARRFVSPSRECVESVACHCCLICPSFMLFVTPSVQKKM